MGWQGLDCGDRCVADGLGAVVCGRVQEHDTAGSGLDRGVDGRLALLADDEVALPVTGTARSSTSTGRWLIMTIGVTNLGRRC